MGSELDIETFKKFMAHFPTGLVVVTGLLNGKAYGLTCQAFASLSLHPILVMFSISKTSKSWPYIEQSGKFCANVLSDKQKDLAIHFSISSTEKFENVFHNMTEDGAVHLNDSVFYIQGDITQVIPVGDHRIVIGKPFKLEFGSGAPLVYFKSKFHKLLEI